MIKTENFNLLDKDAISVMKELNNKTYTKEVLHEVLVKNPYVFKNIIFNKKLNYSKNINMINNLSILKEIAKEEGLTENTLFKSDLNSINNNILLKIIKNENESFSLEKMFNSRNSRGLALITKNYSIYTTMFIKDDYDLHYMDHAINKEAIYLGIYGKRELFDKHFSWQQNVQEDGNTLVQFTDNYALFWVNQDINLLQYNELIKLNEAIKIELDKHPNIKNNYRFDIAIGPFGKLYEDRRNLDDFLDDISYKFESKTSMKIS